MRKIFLLLIVLPYAIYGQVISTISGNGIAANIGDGGPATAAELDYPTGGTFDKLGNYYFTLGTHGNCVRKITPSGIITTVAGIGTAGFSGDNGLATAAMLNNTQTVAVDSFGNLYIGDVFNNRIRKVDVSTGIITTFAGSGISSFAGDGGPATAANFEPNNLCFDKHGNLYFNDVANYRIRKINRLGIVSTIAGNGVSGFGGNGVSATSVPINPYGICIDNFDNLFFADDYGRVYKVNTSGVISYFAGTGVPGSSGDGEPATAAVTSPTYLVMDQYNNLFIAEQDQAKIRFINNNGIISTIVGNGTHGYSGDGGQASLAEINYPAGITLDSCGNLYITDAHDWRIRKVTYPYCGYLSVINENTVLKTSIYPNPTNDQLQIDNITTFANYNLRNIVGSTVKKGTLKKGSNSISLSTLPTGMYLLEMIDEDGNKTVKKIIKQ